jgi:hypothetical protein
VYLRRHVAVWRDSVKTPDVLKLGIYNAASLFGLSYVCYDACIRRCTDVARKNWFQILYTNYFELHTLVTWARCGVVGSVTVLQARRSRVRFRMVSILPAAVRP